MILSAAVAPLIGGFEGLFHYLQTALAYLVPPVAALFLLGSLWRRPGPAAALTTLIGGHGLSVLLFTLTQLGLLNLHFRLLCWLLVSGDSNRLRYFRHDSW
jgi:SSS family solute:Na+ symporter